MSWVRFSLKHPVPTIVAFLVALVLGAVSVTRLPVDLYPAMEFPIAVVAVQYEGAGPQEVEQLVSKPVEEIMGTIGGVTSVSSTNAEGQSLVVVQFDWGTDMDQAMLSMREKVDQVKGFFPDGTGQPNVFKIDPQALPVLTVGLTGEQNLNALKQVAEDTIKTRLERIDGVASVSVKGGSEREIQVIVDPRRLTASGISINQVAQLLRFENLNLPGGEVQEGPVNMLVRTIGQFDSVDEIRNLRLGTVRLGDIAEVRDTFAEVTSKVWINGQPAVSLDIQKQTGSNTLAVANAVKAELAKLEAELPGGVKATILGDQSKMVMSSAQSIADSGWQGGLLAVLILFLFLRHFRATLAVAVAIPVSVVTTFGPLFFGGVTLNMMSMAGLSLGVGMMVDSAIVVLDNIFRHKEMGKDVFTASLEGTAEVVLAVAASTLTSVAVFLPVVWIEGMAKQYFKELALSVTFSLLTSLAVSVTIVPILATVLLKDRKGPAKPPSRLYIRIGEWLDRLDSAYGRLLVGALRRRRQVIAVGVASLAVAGVAVNFMGFEFIPQSDTGEFRISVKMPPGTRLEETERALTDAAQVVKALPEIKTWYMSLGSSGDNFTVSSGGANQGYLVGMLKSKSEGRDRGLDEVMEAVRNELALPGAQVTLSVAGTIDVGGVPIEIILSGEDLGVLEGLADQIAREVAQVPGTREVRTSVDEGLPEVQVKVDRARAASYFLSPSQVAQAVQSAVKGQEVSKFRVGGKEYDIRLQATEASRRDQAALSNLLITSPTGQSVPLADIATISKAVGPTVVERDDQSRVVRVTAQLYNRDLGSVMSDIKASLATMPFPPGYEVAYGGQDEMMTDAFGGLALALAFAIVLVYLVMVAQFESFLHPFVIMFTVPLAAVGAIVALVITGRNLDISGMIGVILLVGIVVNNAIVLVDYINQLRRNGHDRDEAIRIAGPTRLRPVLMTTLTTLLGLFPMALAVGEGSELMAPMATVVMGGLALSTLLTLVVIPVMYSLIDDLLKKMWGKSTLDTLR
jgi:hydrophobic/amphiphilic exporter-1 (mainly G- bacteria), HAE1 family